jgi:hypothetical protein
MKRTIQITIEVDSSEYEDIGETVEDTLDLVTDMIHGYADFPPTYTVSCQGITRTIDESI